jgi:hypothetical protein
MAAALYMKMADNLGRIRGLLASCFILNFFV